MVQDPERNIPQLFSFVLKISEARNTIKFKAGRRRNLYKPIVTKLECDKLK